MSLLHRGYWMKLGPWLRPRRRAPPSPVVLLEGLLGGGMLHADKFLTHHILKGFWVQWQHQRIFESIEGEKCISEGAKIQKFAEKWLNFCHSDWGKSLWQGVWNAPLVAPTKWMHISRSKPFAMKRKWWRLIQIFENGQHGPVWDRSFSQGGHSNNSVVYMHDHRNAKKGLFLRERVLLDDTKGR